MLGVAILVTDPLREQPSLFRCESAFYSVSAFSDLMDGSVGKLGCEYCDAVLRRNCLFVDHSEYLLIEYRKLSYRAKESLPSELLSVPVDA